MPISSSNRVGLPQRLPGLEQMVLGLLIQPGQILASKTARNRLLAVPVGFAGKHAMPFFCFATWHHLLKEEYFCYSQNGSQFFVPNDPMRVVLEFDAAILSLCRPWLCSFLSRKH